MGAFQGFSPWPYGQGSCGSNVFPDLYLSLAVVLSEIFLPQIHSLQLMLFQILNTRGIDGGEDECTVEDSYGEHML